jgi:ankyrin repeat protein
VCNLPIKKSISLSFQLSFLLLILSVSLYWKDNDGQTPLHYAVVCEREAIAEYLRKENAATDIKDNDGNSPSDLCEANWPCMQVAGKQID